jgi:ribosomal protein S18 acetylase RimI-like enzyme
MFRPATVDDVEVIAALHVHSWSEHYRGVYSDAFLDNEAIANRLEVWSQRLRTPLRGQFTTVAEIEGSLVGFAHVIPDEDPIRGAVLQNLHVHTTAQRMGVGTGLLAEAARTLQQRRPASALHVWAREDNAPARAFYEALRGTCVDRKDGGPFADGSRAPVLCYWWANPGIRFTSS